MHRQLTLTRTPFSRHYTVLNTVDNTPLYHVDHQSSALPHSRQVPALVLHRGSSSTGPVAAVSHMPRLSPDCQFGLGDPVSSPNDVQWEDLVRKSATAGEYHFSIEVTGRGRRQFVWKRTRSVGVDGKKPPVGTLRNYKLLDAETGRVQAVFTSRRGWSTCGMLQMEGGDDEEEVVVLVTLLSVYEKARRRAARSA